MAVVGGVDKQRRRIAHEFQPMIDGAFVDLKKMDEMLTGGTVTMVGGKL